jgi:hypothetical protein
MTRLRDTMGDCSADLLLVIANDPPMREAVESGVDCGKTVVLDLAVEDDAVEDRAAIGAVDPDGRYREAVAVGDLLPAILYRCVTTKEPDEGPAEGRCQQADDDYAPQRHGYAAALSGLYVTMNWRIRSAVARLNSLPSRISRSRVASLAARLPKVVSAI